jgi:hypothetical protein
LPPPPNVPPQSSPTAVATSPVTKRYECTSPKISVNF